MKFDVKMASNIADCYNEIDNDYDLIIPKLFSCAKNGAYDYSTSFDCLGKDRYKVIVNRKDELKSLGFKVDIDEDMKIATISW